MDFSEISIADWNDAMVRKYHKNGTRFEKGFFLKRKMEYGVFQKMLHYASIKKTDKVCDIGCGEGFLLKEIEGARYIVGIEISITALKRAKEILNNRPEIEIIKADAQKIPIPDEIFDVVLCSEVLEHLPDPKIVLKEIHRIIKHKGRLVISVPNEKRVRCILSMARMFKLSGMVEGVSTEGNVQNEWHLQEASEKWLKEICRDLFEIKKIEFYPKFLDLRIITLTEKK